jgi:predicted GH43/DUF377 family glycosyl hydrolase
MTMFDFPNLFGSRLVPVQSAMPYADGRPSAHYRLAVQDHGVVMRHGDGPFGCDQRGARDVWVWEHAGIFYMHYDGAGPDGWLTCLAESRDLIHWEKKGPVLDLGAPGSGDSASASYGTTFFDGRNWHMFYMGTPHASPPPDFVPKFPYTTMKALSERPAGPWRKQPEVIAFRPVPGTYYSDTASPGQILEQGGNFLMFFSTATADPILRTLGIARTTDLNEPWTVQPNPIVPPTEQIENSSIYFDPADTTWYLFTNHVGISTGHEYTDGVWVYWTRNLDVWDPINKAVVLDGSNCSWSRVCIGLPSVLKVGNRLAVFYDAPGGSSTSHMNRDIGLAWLDLPEGL